MPRLVLVFVISLIFVSSCKRGRVRTPDAEPRGASEQTLIDANRVLVKKDRQRIEGFVKRKGWKMKETDTGLWYEILEDGTGDTIEEGQRVKLKYTISLLDGSVCYDSEEDGNKEFLVGKGGVESGLEQGILLCKKQTKARFIMPPHLAHGLPGDGKRIPARSTIVYEVTVLSIENTK